MDPVVAQGLAVAATVVFTIRGVVAGLEKDVRALCTAAAGFLISAAAVLSNI